MRGYRSLAIVSIVLALASMACAQNAQDDFTATVNLLLAAAEEGDADTVDGLLHETFVMVEAEGDLISREEALEEIGGEAAPENLEVLDYEAKVYGDLGYAVVPLAMDMGEAPFEGTPAIIAVGVMTDDGWQFVNITLCIMLEDPENVPEGPVKDAIGKLWQRLETFGEVGATGDAKAFFEMCSPDGVMAGPYGPNGEMAVARVADIVGMADDMPDMQMMPVENGDEEAAIGIGNALVATNMDVTMGGETALTREVAIMAWDEDAQEWMVVVAAEAPVEE